MNYDFKKGKENVIEILNSTMDVEQKNIIPSNENEFTYDNGIKTNVAALFIDIRNSTRYFKNNGPKTISKVIRAFCSEIISILKEDKNSRQIGIRGDCVYCIYTAPDVDVLVNILDTAVTINTFQLMFQEILENKNIPNFEIGIGLGLGSDIVIKAGKKYSDIKDYIWIGDAVIDACNNSSLGNSGNFKTIVINDAFYNKVKNNINYKGKIDDSFELTLDGDPIWNCDLVWKKYKEWIIQGMK